MTLTAHLQQLAIYLFVWFAGACLLGGLVIIAGLFGSVALEFIQWLAALRRTRLIVRRGSATCRDRLLGTVAAPAADADALTRGTAPLPPVVHVLTPADWQRSEKHRQVERIALEALARFPTRRIH